MEDEKDALLAEAQLVSKFKHPNVICCYGQVTRGEPKMIVFELMESGSLYCWLGKHGEVRSWCGVEAVSKPVGQSPTTLCALRRPG